MIEAEYYDWICSLVDMYNDDYTLLLEHLYNIDFYPLIPLDDNRMCDGAALWEIFADEHDIDYNNMDDIPAGQISVLEVMIGLAYRMENTLLCDVDFGDRTALWFWTMVKSMGLRPYDDNNYDCAEVDDIVNTMLERKFDRDGKGSLFHVQGTSYDMRELEIWRQMHAFICELM